MKKITLTLLTVSTLLFGAETNIQKVEKPFVENYHNISYATSYADSNSYKSLFYEYALFRHTFSSPANKSPEIVFHLNNVAIGGGVNQTIKSGTTSYNFAIKLNVSLMLMGLPRFFDFDEILSNGKEYATLTTGFGYSFHDFSIHLGTRIKNESATDDWNASTGFFRLGYNF